MGTEATAAVGALPDAYGKDEAQGPDPWQDKTKGFGLSLRPSSRPTRPSLAKIGMCALVAAALAMKLGTRTFARKHIAPGVQAEMRRAYTQTSAQGKQSNMRQKRTQRGASTKNATEETRERTAERCGTRESEEANAAHG